MNEETLQRLSELVKDKCRITWYDTTTDNIIKNIVENAVEAVRHKLGMGDVPPETFLKPGLTRTIFENYCMYDWNNMLEEFDRNYIREILAERHRYEVQNAKKESEKL